jgi:hypothetical protein
VVVLRSDGTKRGFSFGIREKDDVMAAVRFMKEQKGLPRVRFSPLQPG